MQESGAVGPVYGTDYELLRIDPNTRAAMDRAGVSDFGLETTENHEAFIRALDAAKASNRNGAAADSQELRGAAERRYLYKSGAAQGAVKLLLCRQL